MYSFRVLLDYEICLGKIDWFCFGTSQNGTAESRPAGYLEVFLHVVSFLLSVTRMLQTESCFRHFKLNVKSYWYCRYFTHIFTAGDLSQCPSLFLILHLHEIVVLPVQEAHVTVRTIPDLEGARRMVYPQSPNFSLWWASTKKN